MIVVKPKDKYIHQSDPRTAKTDKRMSEKLTVKE